MKHLLFICMLAKIFDNSATMVIPGDMLSPASFTFTLLNNIIFDTASQITYVGSSVPVINELSKAYAVSALLKGYLVFVPMLTPNALVDGELKSINPLYGQALIQLGLGQIVLPQQTRYIPLAVSADEPNIVYAILNMPALTNSITQMLKTDPLEDAAGGTNTQVGGLAVANNGFTAAVWDATTVFSNALSNAVLSGHVFFDNTQMSNDGCPPPAISFSLRHSYSIPYNNTLPALAITGPPVVFTPGSNVALFSDLSLNALYVGVVIDSSVGGSRAVTILDQPIVPATAVDVDSIIATTTNDPVAAFNLSTIHTSTNLSYLIAMGGIGAVAAADKNQVYAMPLINYPSSPNLGTLANVNIPPVNAFSGFYPYPLYGTFLITQATASGDLYTTASIEARVGGGPLLSAIDPYTITQLFSYEDAVFAQANSTAGGTSGLFYSQALFDEKGMISAWTAWQRKTLIGDYNFNNINQFTGNYYGIPTNDSSSVVQTVWGIDAAFVAFSSLVSVGSTPMQCGGVQGVQDISYKHFAVGADGTGRKPSFLMQTGYNTVILQQTASLNSTQPVVPPGLFVSFNGSLQGFTAPVGSIVFSGGGELNSAGALVSGDLAYSLTGGGLLDNAWFVVGGAGGVFVLAAPDGTGTLTLGNGIQNEFSNMNPQQYWQQLGNYQNVKRVRADGGYLYVLTDDRLDRIALNAAQIQAGIGCTITNLASAAQMNNQFFASFADLLVSEKFALLATSFGLYRIGNGANVQLATMQGDCRWTAITLPEGVDPVVYLYPVSRTGVPTDICKGTGILDDLVTGNVQVLASEFGTHQGRIYRFACYDTKFHQVSDTTFQMLPVFFIKDHPSYFWDTKAERMSVATDGASWYLNYVYSTGLLFRGILEILPAYLQSGVPSTRATFTSALVAQVFNSILGPATFISGPGLWATGSVLGIYTLR